ncbi:MAG: DUF6054 family protein [Micrococcales bacterium]|nr:DUF6054 family protein [Micrococcales bacterium]
MAKYERKLQGDFDEFLAHLNQGILKGSISAHFEDGSDYRNDGVRCATRVYERYSAMGGNRLSLSITVVGSSNDLFLSAITSGGSQAVFFKINTLGEGAFIRRLAEIVDNYRPQQPLPSR